MSLALGDTVGILGGGQLGRMMAMAAARLGLKAHVFAPEPDAPAFDVAAGRTVAAFDDRSALAAFDDAVNVVTFEFENVPVDPLDRLSTPIRPPLAALRVAQDRWAEKTFLRQCGLPVADTHSVDGPDALAAALAAVAGPAILKTRRMGYDGKGQVRLAPGDNVAAALAAIGNAPAILEAVVPFVAETSSVVVRGADGAVAAYDMPRNEHAGGILRRSILPGPLDPATAAFAGEHASLLCLALNYVGVLTVEWFMTGDPKRPLIANEIAPRVHNSGHWTEDGAVTSQFENHMRAVAGWPLGAVTRHTDITMINLIGADIAALPAFLADPAARPHVYGKGVVREGRKMGHVNRIGAAVPSADVDNSAVA